MSKSVLVIETPESCRDCGLRFDSYGQCEVCVVADDYPIVDEHYEEGTKPDWCPLRPLPSYKNLKQHTDNTRTNLEAMLSYQFFQGYNTCLQEIGGEEND